MMDTYSFMCDNLFDLQSITSDKSVDKFFEIYGQASDLYKW